jgi:hypothetical protein
LALLAAVLSAMPIGCCNSLQLQCALHSVLQLQYNLIIELRTGLKCAAVCADLQIEIYTMAQAFKQHGVKQLQQGSVQAVPPCVPPTKE